MTNSEERVNAQGAIYPLEGPPSRLPAMVHITRILDAVDLATRTFIGGLLIVIGIMMLLQVVSRQVLHLPIPWTQEVVLISMVWMTFLGAAVAVRSYGHFVVAMVPELLPYELRRFWMVGVFALMFVLCAFLLIYGGQFAVDGLRRVSYALEISLFWTYLAQPVSAALMMLFLAERIVCHLYPSEPLQ